MSAVAGPSLLGSRRLELSPSLVAVVCMVAVTAVALVAATQAAPPPLALVVAGGIALLSFTALTLTRFDTAVALAFLGMAVVRIEPAPVDAAFAVIFALSIVTGRFRIADGPMSTTAATLALLLLTGISTMFAVATVDAVRFGFITVYLGVLALWLTGWLDSERRARIVVVTWLVVGVASAVVTSLAINLPIPGRELFITEDLTRGRALFKDPNVYAPFLVPIAVILLEQRLNPTLLRLRGATSAVLLILLALGILFGYSRAAWANFLIAVVITLGAIRVAGGGGGRRASRALVSMVLVGIAIVAVIGATGSLDFLEQRAQLQSYDTERFSAQAAGVQQGLEQPVGIGPGQWQFYFAVETHSTYVRVLAEQGILGLLAWVSFLTATLIFALRNVLLRRDAYGIGPAALLGAWCGIIFNSFVVDTLHWRHIWVVAALIWVGAVAHRRRAGLR